MYCSEVKKQLKMLTKGEVNPKEEWVKKNRELLLSQIKNTISDGKEVKTARNFGSAFSILFSKSFTENFARPALIILLVFGVASSGWVTTVDAAYQALPGDWLYPAKRAVESTQLAVAAIMRDKSSETELHLEFAKRRATETQKMINSNDPSKKDKIEATMADLKNEMNNVNSNLAMNTSTNSDDQGVTAEVAQDVNQNAEQIKNVLQEVKDNLLVSTATGDKDLSQQVTEAKDLVKDTGIKAVEVLVTKNLDGDQTVSRDEVKQELDNTLQNAVSDAAASTDNINGANQMLQDVNTKVKDLSDGKEANTSTKEISDKLSIAMVQTQEATKQTADISTEMDKNVNEALQMLNSDNLAGVVDKVKQVSENTKQTEKISDNAITAVQSVLPIVSVITGNVTPVVSTSTASSSTATTTVPGQSASSTPIASTTPAISSSTPVGVTSTIVATSTLRSTTTASVSTTKK